MAAPTISRLDVSEPRDVNFWPPLLKKGASPKKQTCESGGASTTPDGEIYAHSAAFIAR